MMNKTRPMAVLAALTWLALGICPVPSQAGITLQAPAGLAPGAQFRFVFVTDGTTNALSTDITTYDSFVQTQADGATYNGATVNWLAIGSTASVNAIDHIGQTDTPVYLVDGTLVTTSTTPAGLWSANLFNPISEDINGATQLGENIWTGTSTSGTAST